MTAPICHLICLGGCRIEGAVLQLCHAGSIAVALNGSNRWQTKKMEICRTKCLLLNKHIYVLSFLLLDFRGFPEGNSMPAAGAGHNIGSTPRLCSEPLLQRLIPTCFFFCHGPEQYHLHNLLLRKHWVFFDWKMMEHHGKLWSIRNSTYFV